MLDNDSNTLADYFLNYKGIVTIDFNDSLFACKFLVVFFRVY